VSVASVASEQAYGTCGSCGAALVSDQRYCLECGAPCSPVRLAFLDVLQSRPEGVAMRNAPVASDGVVYGPAGVLPLADAHSQQGAAGWARRNSGLLSLVAVLALILIAGLLIGHWAGQGGTPSKQVVEVRFPGGTPFAGAASSGTTGATGASSASKATSSRASSASEGGESEEKETAAENAPPPPAKKVNLTKLSSSTGKKHNEEIEAATSGGQPLETTGH
jgi:hypothetical protein